MDRREHLDDLEEGLRLAIESAQARMWTALPGIVRAVDLARQTVSVQPSIHGEITASDGTVQTVTLPLLVDVPIVWPRAGGFALTLPVTVGDEVLVVFASRCIDAWWQNGGTAVAAESRTHDLSDGFAILGPTSQPKKLSAVQTDGLELRTEDRSTYIKLTAGTIFIKGNVVHEGNMNRTGTMQTSGLISGNSGLSIDNTVAVAPVTLTGNIQHTGTLQSNGKNIGSTHTHSGVQVGAGNTGAPN